MRVICNSIQQASWKSNYLVRCYEAVSGFVFSTLLAASEDLLQINPPIPWNLLSHQPFIVKTVCKSKDLLTAVEKQQTVHSKGTGNCQKKG